VGVGSGEGGGKREASILTEWGFEPEFVNVTYNWNSLSVSSEAVSCLDIVRLGADLCGKFESHKDKIFNEALEKGIISDMSEPQNNEFRELRESAKQMFQ
jgi:hypothetical protein